MQQMKKTERYSVRDYRSWDDDQRWELIDGVAYAMAPAPLIGHQKLVVEIVHALKSHLADGRCQVLVSPVDVYLQDDDEGDTVVQPDVVVVCDPAKIKRHGIVGAPDIVTEVLSPSTSSRDFTDKLNLYEREGVAEYWIVSPDEKLIVQYTLSGGKYSMNKVTEGCLVSSRLPEFKLDIAVLFASLNGLVND